jgi:hypothetical protein
MMSFVKINKALLILSVGRKLNFLIFSILSLRFGKIRCGSLFRLIILLNKGKQGYGGIITMWDTHKTSFIYR